jgi:hypothetical protein
MVKKGLCVALALSALLALAAACAPDNIAAPEASALVAPAEGGDAVTLCGNMWDYTYTDPNGGHHYWHAATDPTNWEGVSDVSLYANYTDPDGGGTTVSNHMDGEYYLHIKCGEE